MQAAADTWSAALIDSPRSVVIEIGFTGLLGSNTLAAAVGGGPRGAIGFNLSQLWFADPTPFDNEEYSTEVLTFEDLGAGSLNTGIEYFGGTGLAALATDLYSVALHELGHVLGLNLLFVDSHGESAPIIVGEPLPGAGSVIPHDNAHLMLPTAVMFPFFGHAQRHILSDADILAVAMAGGYQSVRLNELNPVAVPEPATLVLVGIGLAVLGQASGPRLTSARAVCDANTHRMP